MKTGRLALCALLAAAVLLLTAPSMRGPAAAPEVPPSLAGQLLVALPSLEDPRFTKTVIFMVAHSVRGASGLIVNRPLGDIPIAVLLKQAGLPDPAAKGTVKLHVGGPVEPTRISVLHTDDFRGQETNVLGGGLAVTTQPDVLQAIAAGKGPRQARFFVGYAGWAPGQLEAEIRDGAWITVPADEAILFDEAYETKWDRAMAKRRINL